MSKTTLTFVLLGAALLSIGCQQRVVVFEIPNGYVGWVTIQYDKETCDEGQQGIWRTIVTVRPDGFGCSKQWLGPERLFFVRYFYVDQSGRRIHRLESTGWGEGGEIWAQSSTPAEDEFHFFVGTEGDFNEVKSRPKVQAQHRGTSR